MQNFKSNQLAHLYVKLTGDNLRQINDAKDALPKLVLRYTISYRIAA